MKRLLLTGLSALTFTLTGCQLFGPMPKNSASIQIPGGPQLVFVHELNTYVSDVQAEYDPATKKWKLKIGGIISTNDPYATSTAYTGQALVIREAFSGAEALGSKAFMAGKLEGWYSATNTSALRK